MKKSIKIIFGIISMLILGVFILFLFTNEFERKIKIYDCVGNYYSKIYDKSKDSFGYHNAEVKVAKCLCEKYEQDKREDYKIEIIKIYSGNEWFFQDDLKYKKNVDTICKHRNKIFFDLYDM